MKYMYKLVIITKKTNNQREASPLLKYLNREAANETTQICIGINYMHKMVWICCNLNKKEIEEQEFLSHSARIGGPVGITLTSRPLFSYLRIQAIHQYTIFIQ